MSAVISVSNAVYHMHQRQPSYEHYRTTDTEQRSKEQLLGQLKQRVERLGYHTESG